MGSRMGGIDSMEVVYCVLIIVKEVEGFSYKIMTFLVYIIFKKSGSILAIKLGV